MNGKIILTNHAKQRMQERGISIEEIKENIDFPDYTIKKGNKIESIKKDIKVLYTKDKFIKIITVIKK
jgi:hypothetical protein